MAEKQTAVFKIDNKEAQISKAIDFVQCFLKKTSFSPDFNTFISVVMDELLSNIIRYAFQDDLLHKISISLSVVEHKLCLVLQDDGMPFNPLDYPVVDTEIPLEKRKLGGLGIYIVRQIMDSVKYENKDGMNILTLCKAEASK